MLPFDAPANQRSESYSNHLEGRQIKTVKLAPTCSPSRNVRAFGCADTGVTSLTDIKLFKSTYSGTFQALDDLLAPAPLPSRATAIPAPTRVKFSTNCQRRPFLISDLYHGQPNKDCDRHDPSSPLFSINVQGNKLTP